MTSTKSSKVFLPPQELEELTNTRLFLENASEPAMLLGPDGQQVGLPEQVYEALVKAVEAMMSHKAVAIVPIDQKLTTQDAADFLGVSRPTLIKQLEKGAIPYEKLHNSRHRRIRLSDLLDYQSSEKAKRSQIFKQMTEQAESCGLYDDLG